MSVDYTGGAASRTGLLPINGQGFTDAESGRPERPWADQFRPSGASQSLIRQDRRDKLTPQSHLQLRKLG